MADFKTDEKHTSQIPALRLLANLGYKLLTPAEALTERNHRYSDVLLENILRKQLAKINRIRYRGEEYHFSEANIQEAVQRLKNVQYDGLVKTNQKIYDLLTLGIAPEQTIDGDTKSHTLNYIDWKNINNNVFHAVPEFEVERSHSEERARPDIVLFVNGIPLCVIECKAPSEGIEQGISQNIRNQGDGYIPKLFTYTQLIMAVCGNAARYATTGTSEKFWSVWNEMEDKDSNVLKSANKPLSDAAMKAIRSISRDWMPAPSKQTLLLEQDKAVYSLCRPQRLLDLTYRFIVFEYGEKKIARYQQFFVVESTLRRVKQRDAEQNRKGGIIWHTQGSGKSLTMVMLVRSLALDEDIPNHRIIVVSDRDDLDRQLSNTFAACGSTTHKRATSGRNLVNLIRDKVGIITTLIHKFDKGWRADKYIDNSADIFVIVDESHRTNYGELAVRRRQMLPNACYLAFTGTPLMNKEKNSFRKFGDLINPSYPIRQAVKDKAVVPLLYEGRHVEIRQDKEAIDLWFERHTAGLSAEQKADLKRKYARAEMLNKADRVIYMRAFDISEHYRENWRGTDFKAQLVAPNKLAAIKYHKYLKEIGSVNAEVIISAPDTREGHEDVGAGPTDEVGKFWQEMMSRFGAEAEYNKNLIGQFKNNKTPEILIVVDKLLTGFDAPRNTVLYLCRILREHTLLQAIARVNRLFKDKEFGYIIDYASSKGELDKALKIYDAFDEKDIEGTLTLVDNEIAQLPQRYSELLDIFKDIGSSSDEEEYERFLADDDIREGFYDRLTAFGKVLKIALSTDKFVMETPERKLKQYKDDLGRFHKLRSAVRTRYADGINYKLDYEPKIRKLLDTHIQADRVITVNEQEGVFTKTLNATKDRKSLAAQADRIAHKTKKTITEKAAEDPALYQKFSKLIQKAIDDFNASRISESEYLERATEISNSVTFKRRDDVPDRIKENEEACAYFGAVKSLFAKDFSMPETDDNILCEIAIAVQQALEKERKVDFWNDEQALNKTKGRIDDYFYDVLRDKHGIKLSGEQMNAVTAEVMKIAGNRRDRRPR